MVLKSHRSSDAAWQQTRSEGAIPISSIKKKVVWIAAILLAFLALGGGAFLGTELQWNEEITICSVSPDDPTNVRVLHTDKGDFGIRDFTTEDKPGGKNIADRMKPGQVFEVALIGPRLSKWGLNLLGAPRINSSLHPIDPNHPERCA